MNKKPDRHLAALSGIAIILVVIGHSTAATPERAELISEQIPAYALFLRCIDWIYTFHMPLFLALSGFLYRKTTEARAKNSYGDFLKSKARRLLVPYFVISSLAFPIKAELSRFAMHPVDLSLSSYAHSLLMPWDNPIIFFWFLPTLFLCFLPSPFLLRSEHSKTTDALVLSVFVLLWRTFPHTNIDGPLAVLNIGGALHNYVFFCAGFLVKKYNLIETTPKPLLWAFGLLVSSVVLFCLFPNILWLRFPLAVIGIFLGYFFALSLHGKFLALFSFVGDYSYQIYLLSWFPLVSLRFVANKLQPPDIFVAVLLSIMAAIVIPLLVARLIARSGSRSMRLVLGIGS